jgi:hypothetical protein
VIFVEKFNSFGYVNESQIEELGKLTVGLLLTQWQSSSFSSNLAERPQQNDHGDETAS